MKTMIRTEDNVTIVHLKGDLKEEYVGDFEEKIKHELKHGAKKILVEMDAVNTLDDGGYQALGSCMAAAHRNGVNFVLYFEDDDKLNMFQDSTYADFFTIARTPQQAKQELGKPRRKVK